jgi:hypothetical protein
VWRGGMGQLGPEGLPAYWEELILAFETPSGNAGAYPEFQCARAIRAAGCAWWSAESAPTSSLSGMSGKC